MKDDGKGLLLLEVYQSSYRPDLENFDKIFDYNTNKSLTVP